MWKKNEIIIFLAVFVVSVFFLFGQSTKKDNPDIVEKVDVNWWQVPVFAIDNSRNPITDLQPEDIEIRVNNQPVTNFLVFKRTFSTTEKKEEPGPGPQTPPAVVTTQEEAPPILKKKLVFLLFDVTLSSETSTRKSKTIAVEMIKKIKEDAVFFLLTIEPFTGLRFICGPISDKNQMMNQIDRKIIPRKNERFVDMSKFTGGSFSPMDDGGVRMPALSSHPERSFSHMDDGGGAMDPEAVASFYQRKNESFFYGINSLCLILDSFDDNKFLYLFSEGLSNALRKSVRGGESYYFSRFQQVSQKLGKSGTVLFIINTLGVADPSQLMTEKYRELNLGSEPDSAFTKEEEFSGEISLRYMAKESGGKYIEGENTQIVETIDNMNHAYYEIFFQDIPGIKSPNRSISIKSKQNEIEIHTINTLALRKNYLDMSPLEKELFAFNLAADNPMTHKEMKIQHACVTKIDTGKKSIQYHITLPNDFLKRPFDLYKIWINNEDTEQEVALIEKETINPQKNKIKIECITPKKIEETNKTWPYFVLIDPKENSAVVRVIGDRWIEPEETLAQNEPSHKTETIPDEEFKRLMDGAALYSEKLKTSALHYLCREEITDIYTPFDPYSMRRSNAGIPIDQGINEIFGASTLGRYGRSEVKKHIFDYRLLKKGDDIKEDRELIKSSDIPPQYQSINKDQVIKPTAFMTEKAVFAPITMLDRSRQPLYIFRFLKYDDLKNRKCAVIKVIPRNSTTIKGVYGTIWLDTQDFSLLKIEVAPQSIINYPKLQEAAIKITSKLFLSLEMDFFEIRQGVRFPTEVRMIEKYKGGRTVSNAYSSSGWERVKTIFTYSQYQFFNIQTDVTYE